jgi:Domain of unknown function (DUF5062)
VAACHDFDQRVGVLKPRSCHPRSALRAQIRIAGGKRADVPECHMKKFRHEAELFKAALLAGVKYAESRKAVEFELTDSSRDKALYVYRLLVHDKIISPMPEDQVSEKTIRHRLAAWYAHQLPDGHPLLG